MNAPRTAPLAAALIGLDWGTSSLRAFLFGADGTLLDRCLIFQGAATSRVHDNTNYPLILAGGKQLGHRTGQFVTYDEQKHCLANLFVSIANAMDVPLGNFGDSTGIEMSELFG